MRTTLEIDVVLEAAKDRARRERKTAGQVVSELLRRALTTAESSGVVREPPVVSVLDSLYINRSAVLNGRHLIVL